MSRSLFMSENKHVAKNTGNPAEKESFFKWFLQVFALAAVFLGIYFLIFKFVLSNETVSGPSMQPTFEDGDRIIANRHGTIKRGDIVILDAPDNPGVLYIKRVVGMPGDSVKSENDVTYINNKAYKEPYLDEYKAKLAEGQLYTENFTLKQYFGVDKVPEDSYFVMGDHRDVSKDSRRLGFIKKTAIEGKVVFRYYPFSQIKFF